MTRLLAPSPASPTGRSAPATALRLAGDQGSKARSLDPSSLDPSQPPGAAAWLPISRVAELLGKTEGAIRAKCIRHWSQTSPAQARLIDGSWHVFRGADPILIRADATTLAERERDLRELMQRATTQQRDAARARARAVMLWREWRSRPGIKVRERFESFRAMCFAEIGLEPSWTRLHDWCGRAAASTDIEVIAASLIDRRGGDRRAEGEGKVSDDAWAAYVALYLREPPLSLAGCWAAIARMAADRGWSWCCESRCRQLNAERLPQRVRDYARLGADRADKIHLTPIEQDPDKWLPGECWLGDHSRCDFFARVMSGSTWVARRLWLTAWTDWRSRLLCGWHIGESPNATTIRLALLHALSPTGMGLSVPRRVTIDNGKDYQSAQLHGRSRAAVKQRAEARATRSGAASLPEQHEARIEAAKRLGLFAMLGIECNFNAPYNHNGKARIERFFGVVHEGFDRWQPSWCGSKPGQRDADALAESVADVMSLPTIDEVRASFAAWAKHYNADAARKIEDLDGLSPREFYEQRLPERRIAQASSLLELGHEVSTPRLVTKRGVTLTIGGTTLRYGAGHPALIDLVGSGQEVWCSYDPSDLSRVTVRKVTGQLVCIAERNHQHGAASDTIGKAELRAATAERRRQRRETMRAIAPSRALLTDVERAALIARDNAASAEHARLDEVRAASDQAPMRLVRTIMDQDAGEAQRQREQSVLRVPAIDKAEQSRRRSVVEAMLAEEQEQATADVVLHPQPIDLLDVDPEDHVQRVSVIDALLAEEQDQQEDLS